MSTAPRSTRCTGFPWKSTVAKTACVTSTASSPFAQPHHVFNYAGGDLADMAAAYAYHLAENQCFIDGNKRTAVLAALYFLELNGVNTSPLTNDELYDAMIGIAEKRVDKAGLAAIFRKQTG